MDRQARQEEDKLLLLYIVSRMGAMEEQSLERFVMENGLMDYLNVRLAVGELAESGLFQPLNEEEGRVLLISPAGMQALEYMQTRLPYSKRAQVDELCAAWRARLLKEKQVMAQYMPHPGGCIARLYYQEENARMADISLELPDTESAKRLCRAWEEDTARLYNELLRALGVRET